MSEPNLLVVARPAKPWHEMTDAEKDQFIESAYNRMVERANSSGSR